MKFRSVVEAIGLIVVSMLSSASLSAGSNVRTPSATPPSSLQSNEEVIAIFDAPVASSDLARIVLELNLVPKEIYYYGTTSDEADGISGGYALSEGESLESALEGLLDKHTTFLNRAITSNKKQLKTEKDPVAVAGLRKLNKQFHVLLQEAEDGDIALSAAKLENSPAISALADHVKVRSVVAVPLERNQEDREGSQKDISPQSLWHESWAPYYGTSRVTQGFTFQTFYFNNTSAFGSTSTYEHETQIYNRNFARYDNYWSSNMPRAYYDTPFTDTVFNPTVGTSQASSLRAYTQYYTYMALRAGTERTATVRIKGQRGHRYPSWCYSTWCIWADATTATSMLTFTAPTSGTLQYYY